MIFTTLKDYFLYFFKNESVDLTLLKINLIDFNSCRACPSCPVSIIMPIREKSFRKNFLLRGASKYSPLKRKALQIVSNSKYYIIKLFDYQSIIHSNISIIKV